MTGQRRKYTAKTKHEGLWHAQLQPAIGKY